MAASQDIRFLEWTEEYLPAAKHDLLSSGVGALSIADLLNVSENRKQSEGNLSLDSIKPRENDSGAGGIDLRRNLAALYSVRSGAVAEDDLLITNGGSAADYTVLAALLSPSDHVICQHPVDEPLRSVPVSLGAEVTWWNADPAKNWTPDLDELKTLIKANTKMIILQSPCDPTGAIISKPILEGLVEVAEEKSIIIMANESYRPLFHSISPSDEKFPPSAINLGYKKVVVTGSISRAYGLPWARAGWIATKDKDILTACKRVRRLQSKSASRMDETLAAEAVSDRCIHALLARNLKQCQTNLALLEGFIQEHSWGCSWIRPLAGTTAMLKFHKMGKPVDAEELCLKLLRQSGVLVCPAGKCFGDAFVLRGYVRVAFGGSTEEVKAALAAWTTFMEESFESVPTVSNKPTT